MAAKEVDCVGTPTELLPPKLDDAGLLVEVDAIDEQPGELAILLPCKVQRPESSAGFQSAEAWGADRAFHGSWGKVQRQSRRGNVAVLRPSAVSGWRAQR